MNIIKFETDIDRMVEKLRNHDEYEYLDTYVEKIEERIMFYEVELYVVKKFDYYSDFEKNIRKKAISILLEELKNILEEL